MGSTGDGMYPSPPVVSLRTCMISRETRRNLQSEPQRWPGEPRFLSNAHGKFLAGALMQGRDSNFYGTAGSRWKDDDRAVVLLAISIPSHFVLVVVESQSHYPRKSCAFDARGVCLSHQVFFAFAGGASATAASLVSRRKVNVSWRYNRTAASVWLR